MRIIANSLPKSGTYLLAKLLDLNNYTQVTPGLTGALIRPTQRNPIKRFKVNWRRTNIEKDGLQIDLDDLENKVKRKWLENFLKRIPENSFITAHIPYSDLLCELLINTEFKVLYIVRDPRDVLLSYINHLKRDSRYPFHSYYNTCNHMEQIISVLVPMISKRGQKRNSLKNRVENSVGWIKSAKTCSVRFEDLIGPSGGGSFEAQIITIQRVFEYLDIYYDNAILEKLSNEIFDKNSKTFHKGQIGKWREYFDNRTKNIFKEICGNLLIELGYESDNLW